MGFDAMGRLNNKSNKNNKNKHNDSIPGVDESVRTQQAQLQRRAFMPRCAAHVYIAHFIDYQQKLAQQIVS